MTTSCGRYAMPASGRRDALVDTSVAVPFVVADHAHHTETVDALDGRRPGLSGHAAFETFSVLTRLPAPHRRAAPVVSMLLTRNFPASRFLDGADTEALLRS